MNSIARSVRFLLLSIGMVLTSSSWSTEIVPLYLYNTPPPFNPDTRDNLSDYLATYLSAHSTGHYRFDAIFLPASSLKAVEKQNPDMHEWLYISKRPRNMFHYYIFCDPSNTALMGFINEEITQLQRDNKWLNHMKTWQDYHAGK